MMLNRLLLATSSAPAPTALNPADTSAGLTLSNGNLRATRNSTVPSGWCASRAAGGKTAGKLYFEAKNINASGVGNSGIGAGVGSISFPLVGTPPGFNGSIAAILNTGGRIVSDGVELAALGASWTTSTAVIGIAIDVSARRFWARDVPGGNWNADASANPATGVGGIAFPAAIQAASTPVYPIAGAADPARPDGIELNFGQTAFVGALPGGFAGWMVP